MKKYELGGFVTDMTFFIFPLMCVVIVRVRCYLFGGLLTFV